MTTRASFTPEDRPVQVVIADHGHGSSVIVDGRDLSNYVDQIRVEADACGDAACWVRFPMLMVAIMNPDPAPGAA